MPRARTPQNEYRKLGPGHPYLLNKEHHFVLMAGPNAAGRWKGAERVFGWIQAGAVKAISLTMETAGLVGINTQSIADYGEKIQGVLSNLEHENGIPLIFRAYMTDVPGWSVTNEYGQNAIAGMLNTVVGAAAGALKAGGGITPNLSLAFQLPQTWKGQRPLTFSTSVLITPDTIRSLPAKVYNLYIGQQDQWSEGARVINACLVAVMMAAPRQFIVTRGLESVADVFIAAPPLLDCKVGPFVYQSVRANSVNVEFPADKTYFDENGFPTIARITFNLTTSMTFTQEDWEAMRKSILSFGTASISSSSFILGEEEAGAVIGQLR